MDKAKKEQLSQEIICAVNENSDFAKEFVAAEDVLSVQRVLSAHGFDLSEDDINAMFTDGVDEILKSKADGGEKELSDEQLENVAGGGFLRGVLRTVASGAAAFGYGCFCGLVPAASAAAPYVAGGLAAWSTAGYFKKGW